MKLYGRWHCIVCDKTGEDEDGSSAYKQADKHTKDTGHGTAVTMTTERIGK